MKNNDKTREQLLNELEKSNKRIAELEKSEAERKRAEEALCERERKFSEIIEGNPIVTFVIDADHVVTHWNKACKNMLGILAKEMIGSRETWRPFYPKKRPVLANLIADNASNEDIHGYYGDKFKKSTVIEDAYVNSYM